MSLAGMTGARTCLIGALLGVLLLPCAGAAEEMVPADVVLELMKAVPPYGVDDASLIIGAVPGELSELVALPEDFEVQVSLVWERGTSVFGRSELSEAQLKSQLEAGLAELGWSRYRPETSPTGFQPSRDDSAMLFCREKGGALAVEVESTGSDETRARLKHHVETGYRSCKQAERFDRLMSAENGDVPFPTLHPPDGARSEGGSASSSAQFSRSGRTSLETDLSPSEILAHYASQLGQQGWQADARVEFDSLAYQSWLFLDESGKEWHGLLMVKSAPWEEDRRSVELEVNLLARE